MWWQIAAGANGVIAVAYILISLAIALPLVRTGQLWSNKLGAATALIFFTCAVQHGVHSFHLLGPALGYDESAGSALRGSLSFHDAAWDVVGAAGAVYYWTLRRTYGPLMKGAALFEDMKEKQRQALEINDNIVQGLTVAKLALELDEKEQSVAAMAGALTSASKIISDLLGQAGEENRLGPGDLRRAAPARPGA